MFAYFLLLYITGVCDSFSTGRMEMKFRLQRCSYSISFPCLSENEVAQSCPTLCDLMDRKPLGSSIHGSLQARILEWAAILFSKGSSRPRDRTQVYCIAGRLYHLSHQGIPINEKFLLNFNIKFKKKKLKQAFKDTK